MFVARLPAGSQPARGAVVRSYGTSRDPPTDPGTVSQGSQESHQPTRVFPHVSSDPGLGKRPASHGCRAGRCSATSERQEREVQVP